MFQQLLISVRSIDEAKIVAAAGVSIIDFKEPGDGALAPVDPAIWRAAAIEFPFEVLSAALGESDTGIELACQVPSSFRFAKIGPSGCSTPDSLIRLWEQLRPQLPPTVEMVPVAYADHQSACTLPPLEVLRCAIDCGHARCLIDTFVKDGRGLLDHCTAQDLSQIQRLAEQTNTWWALAGSLTMKDHSTLESWNIRPNCIGIRGDACSTSHGSSRRRGTIDRERVDTWVRDCAGARSVQISTMSRVQEAFAEEK